MCYNRTLQSSPDLAIIARIAKSSQASLRTMWKEWIAEGLRKPGKDQYGLGDALGVDRSAVSKIISGVRELKAKEIEPAARYLDQPPPSRIMPVRYTVGAGQEVFAIDGDEAQSYESVSGLWGVDVELAVVRGDSMWPLFVDGAKIYFGAARGPLARDNRQMRMVRLADDRLLVKIMRRTNDPAIWTLESLNAPPIEDRVVMSVAEIVRIEPS